jgi:hypothetical protein
VALAQELYSSDVDDGGENPSPPRRAGRTRKPAGKEGRLARMVREIRDIEDQIVAKLAATQRHLSQLEARRVHIEAGYTSESEFEERMLAVAPFVRAMREAVPASAHLAVAPGSHRRESADARARKTKALTAVARTLDRMRATDAEIHEAAAKARAKLCAIDGMRTFEECGYSSFDEFLERALGPSPVLSSAVALIAAEPVVVSTESEDNQRVSAFEAETLAASLESNPGDEPESEEAAGDSESGAFSPGLFGESESVESSGLFEEPIDAFGGSSSDDAGDGAATDSGEAPSHDAAAEPAPQATPASPAPSAPAKLKMGMVLSIALCIVGIVGGAAGGVIGAIASDRAHPAAVEAKGEGATEAGGEGKAAEAKAVEGKSKTAEGKTAEGKTAEAKPSTKKAPEAKAAAAARAHAE